MRTLAIASMSAGLVLAGAAFAQVPSEGMFLSAADLKATVGKPVGGLAKTNLPTGPGVTIIAAYRDADGEVEVHVALNDEFVVQDGHANVRVGGRVEGNHQTAPGEWRAGVITGGRTYAMSAGDVLWIPAGSPHQVVVPKGGAFRYLAVKFEAKAP